MNTDEVIESINLFFANRCKVCKNSLFGSIEKTIGGIPGKLCRGCLNKTKENYKNSNREDCTLDEYVDAMLLACELAEESAETI